MLTKHPLIRHQVEAPLGGEYNFNSRTDIGLANKDGIYGADIPASLSITATTAAVKGDSSLKCGICMEPAINITSHINSYHKMTKATYLKICPNDTYKFTVKKVWKCKVCEVAFVNNQAVIKVIFVSLTSKKMKQANFLGLNFVGIHCRLTKFIE